ncbi:hypothetical protein [Yinghuangia seranimata]|uniref:hypothetical protein n=1 Tax=Yinghuangia seranimata TaxID=408067 RepID=UPI00248D14E4|nr:hypothetical protein [Yinghuangia seranimata]MDI2131027.1 hypothetical protein [Yinghuangia seranimata]
MRLPVTRLSVSAAAAVLAFGALTACGGGDASDASVDGKSNPSAPGGKAPGPGQVLPGKSSGAPDARPPAELSGRELADRAVQLMAATSYTLTGKIGAGGDAATVTIKVNKQRDAIQTVARPDMTQELIRVGGTVYANIESVVGPTPGATLPPSLRGTYLKTDGGQLDPKLVDPFAGTFTAGSGEVAKGDVVQVDGKGVWPVSVKSADGATTTMYVMAAGDPYPIKLTVSGGDPLDLKVSDFGADVTVNAPGAAQVIDQATLQQRMTQGG